MVEQTIDIEALDRHDYIIKPDYDEELQELANTMTKVGFPRLMYT